jgi:transposase-like protein
MPEQQTSGHPGKSGTHQISAEAEDLLLIAQLAAEGKTRKGIARALGISNTLLDKWMKRDKLVREAWEAGMALDEEIYTSRLRGSVLDPKDKFGGPAAMFMLKCKHKWAERTQLEVEQVNPIGRSQLNVVEVDPSIRAEFERQLELSKDEA